MSLPLLCALIGFGVALLNYFGLGIVIKKLKQENTKNKGIGIIDFVRKAELIIFPVIGYIIGVNM